MKSGQGWGQALLSALCMQDVKGVLTLSSRLKNLEAKLTQLL